MLLWIVSFKSFYFLNVCCCYVEIPLVFYVELVSSNHAEFTLISIIFYFLLPTNWVFCKKKKTSYFFLSCHFPSSPHHCMLARTSRTMLNSICDKEHPFPQSQRTSNLHFLLNEYLASQEITGAESLERKPRSQLPRENLRSNTRAIF